MKYYKKRVQFELSEKDIAYLERFTAKGEAINDTIREFFYIYLQERKLNNYDVVPMMNTLNITRG